VYLEQLFSLPAIAIRATAQNPAINNHGLIALAEYSTISRNGQAAAADLPEAPEFGASASLISSTLPIRRGAEFGHKWTQTVTGNSG